MKTPLFAALTAFLTAGALVAGEIRETTLPAGTQLRVRLENGVGSDISRSEDPIRARLVNPIVVDGRTIVPAGSEVLGTVTSAVRSGKVKGRAHLSLRFNTLVPTAGHERYQINTRTWSRIAPGTKKKDAAIIGLPAAGGAVVGALVGGKKGAGIGALAGGGGGTAVVLTTRGKEVRLGRGAVLLLRLNAPLTVG